MQRVTRQSRSSQDERKKASKREEGWTDLGRTSEGAYRDPTHPTQEQTPQPTGRPTKPRTTTKWVQSSELGRRVPRGGPRRTRTRK